LIKDYYFVSNSHYHRDNAVVTPITYCADKRERERERKGETFDFTVCNSIINGLLSNTKCATGVA
jgi:hypothetical protein